MLKLVAKIFTLRLRCIQDQWKNMNWPSFSANTLWSEIWEHLNCEHNYTPTKTTLLEQTSQEGDSRCTLTLIHPLHCLIRRILPQWGPPALLVYTGPCSPVSPAPPEDQAGRHLLHFQWQHRTSFRMVPRPICKTPHRMDLSSCSPLSLQVTNPRRHLGGQQSSTSKHLGCSQVTKNT